MYYIAICDDNKYDVEHIKKKACEIFQEIPVLVDISIYTNSKMLQADIEDKKHFDLILSDIEMPDISGMDLTTILKLYLPNVLIVFITSHLKYSIDSYELSIFRYIPKNELDARLKSTLVDAIKILKIQSDKSIVIQTRNRYEKVLLKDILYVRREGKYAVITLTNNTETKVRKNLMQVYDELGREDFAYAERGYIVNLSYIVSIKSGIVELKGGIRLSASTVKLEELKERLNIFLGEYL